MRFLNSGIKKTFAIIIGVILIICILVIIFISPITKYSLEKYDLKFAGREVKMDWIYVNPFTGYIHADNFKIYEAASDSIFFSADGISVNFEMHKLLSKTYEISELIIDKPVGVIIQNKKEFNFTDLIKKFTPKDSLPKKNKKPVHFNILNVKIQNGTFYYKEKLAIHFGQMQLHLTL